VHRVLDPRGGLLGALGALLDKPALLGTTISASAVPGGIRVRVHSALDPTLAGLPGSRSVQFAPTLPSLMPRGSMLMLDVPGLDRAAPAVLRAAARIGVMGRVAPLLSRLGAALQSEGVDLP